MEMGKTLVTRRTGETTPFNASDALAAVCDLYALPIPRAIRARLGKAAKELLDDGFQANVVCAAMYAGVRKARPDLVPSLALELQNAAAGRDFTWNEWRQALYGAKIAQDAELTGIYSTLREAF